MRQRWAATVIGAIGIFTLTMAILGLIDGNMRPALWAFLISGPMLLVVSVLLRRRS